MGDVEGYRMEIKVGERKKEKKFLKSVNIVIAEVVAYEITGSNKLKYGVDELE